MMVAFWPGWYAPNLVLRWAVLLVGLPFVVAVRMTALHWIGLAFLGYAALSLLCTPFPLDGCYELGILAIVAGSFCLGSSLERCDLVFVGAALGLVPSLIVAVMQWIGRGKCFESTDAICGAFTTWYEAHAVLQLTPEPSGLFVNANLMGEASSLVFVGAIAGLRGGRADRWVMVLATASALCLILSHHRTSMIALATAGMTWGAEKRFHKEKQLWLAALCAPLLLLFLCGIIFFTDIPTVHERIGIWRSTVSGLTFFGHGAGSFRNLIPLYFLSESEGGLDYAHNDLLQLAFNYGIAALLPAALFGLLIISSTSPMRYVLLVFGIQSLAEFPLYMPVTGFLAALAAGHCSRDWAYCGWRDVLRGGTLFGRFSRI